MSVKKNQEYEFVKKKKKKQYILLFKNNLLKVSSKELYASLQSFYVNNHYEKFSKLRYLFINNSYFKVLKRGPLL